MTRDLRKRIQKLESQIPRQPNEQDKVEQFCQRFLTLAVSYYLGIPQKKDRPPRPLFGH
jgi:hypothetical protein